MPGPQGVALTFIDRLGRESGWSPATAQAVLEEYRRFCFLAVAAGHPVTPSDAVDRAWHLHLTYTRDYWERFCPDILGQPLHHGPTAGGPDEQHRFYLQYAGTLRSYEHWFGEPPPVRFWPDAATRLNDDPRARWVHPRDAVILPRPLLRWCLLGAAGILALLWTVR